LFSYISIKHLNNKL